jgi:NAD/NADP transhydrogenase alpha subunit
VAHTLKIDGNSGDVLNLSNLGLSGQTGALAPRFTTPVAGASVTNVDGTTAIVSASAAGNAGANDVIFGGHVYDVYQFNTSAGLFTLLTDTTLTTNFVA